MPSRQDHTAYHKSGRTAPPRDSILVVMSILDPNHSRPTLQPLIPLPLFAHLPLPPIRLNSDMSDEPGVQFMGARSKRNHRPMSEEPSDEGQRAWHRHFHPPLVDGSPAPLPPMRPPRHGFDFRRPATTTPREDDVIDLTNEPETPAQRTQSRVSDTWNSNTSRLPRFGRNILTDVVDLEEESANDPGEGPSSSPEVQFVRSTVRHQPTQRLSARMREILDSWTPRDLSTGHSPLDPGYTRMFERFTRLNENVRLGIRDRGYQGPATGPEDVLFLASEGMHDGVFLDYAHPSFPMQPPSPPENRPQRDTYRPPSPAPEGFTRTLGEDDVAICPNCSWELGTGKGRRQEIWVAKPCGHVYCGECAENRSLSKAKKSQGSQRTKPFYKCQVADCGKQVSAPTAMVHLFL